jgi:hypothetical protein
VITKVTRGRYYLAEWYRPELTSQALDDAMAKLERGAAAVSVNGTAVQVLAMLAAPHDEVLYGMFAADCAQIVKQACHQAGFPVERFTENVDARIPGPVPPTTHRPRSRKSCPFNC